MLQVLDQVDRIRLDASKKISLKRKSEFGQFMTPSSVACFMANLYSDRGCKEINLLDAGAGLGSLTCAVLDRFCSNDFNSKKIKMTAYEIDNVLRKHLFCTLQRYKNSLDFEAKIMPDDFIEHAANQIHRQVPPNFTHAILNPPYKKINSNSRHRLLLRKVGIETVNLYSAFVALSIPLMKQGGQIVAIIPRSFCNGPYYKPFREFIFSQAAIKKIHLFDARNKAFKDDKVLQENVIILLERGTKQKDVLISTSTDDTFEDYKACLHPFKHIVHPNDSERFIHIPASMERSSFEQSKVFSFSLSDIDIEVSTGPVVDFRVKKYLRKMPKPGCAPLLYPNHFKGQNIEWPKIDTKKSNALVRHVETNKWLYPKGFYTVVKRFSSKEEKRRIIANVVCPDVFNSPFLGFENHLNVFHFRKQGLQEELVRGLTVFLNSTFVDDYFRQFNGHTQVNATDLRMMKYPSKEILIHLGLWVKKTKNINQDKIDKKLETMYEKI